jgi:type IV secretory pathway VirB2 component (pilin)
MENMRRNLEALYKSCQAFMVAAGLIMFPDVTFAGLDTPIGDVFCTVALWFTGNAGKGLATLAIAIAGIGALLGKISWGVSMLVGTNIALIFGANAVVATLSNSAGKPIVVCSYNIFHF